MSVIQKSSWIEPKVQEAHDPQKCIYNQKPDFYILLNNQLIKECDWCPFEAKGCEVCGGLDDILMHECYECNKCKIWG